MAQRDEEGAAAVEFAFLLPLLVLLLFGIIQFGIALNTRIQATNAAREAARAAVIGIDNWDTSAASSSGRASASAPASATSATVSSPPILSPPSSAAP